MTSMLVDPTLVDGRYRLGRELGAGAFGAVYMAKQVVNGHGFRDVALKLIHAHAIQADQLQEQLKDGLVLIDLLSHHPDWEVRQHFVSIYDLGVTREPVPRAYVAMELVPGGSLAGRLRELRHFSLHGTLHYMLQIARAMAFMHDNGFVHSDLKPENVLVFQGRGQDLVKIGDFGLAGRYSGRFGKGPSGGTLSYLSPEALQGTNTTFGGDVFSMGVMAYEMLTGENPYNRVGHTLDPLASDYNARMSELQLLSRKEPLTLKRKNYPELNQDELSHLIPFLDVVNRMLAPDSSIRQRRAREVLTALQNIRDGKLPPPEGDSLSGKSSDPLASLISDCEYLLETKCWGDAEEKINKLIKLAPSRTEGYLLQSRSLLAQAEVFATKNPPKAHEWRQKAISPLQQGIGQCVEVRDQRRLRQELANLYRRQGDNHSAELVLKMIEESKT